MNLRVLGITMLMVLSFGGVLVACNDTNDEPPATEFRVVTGEPNVNDLQATITYLETQQGLPAATATLNQIARQPIGQGVVINGDAVIFAEPEASASEMGIAPQNSEVLIFEITAPDRIGLVFYNIQYESLLGWVASTQIQLQNAVPPTVAAVAQANTAIPVTPSKTFTPAPTFTFTPSPTATISPTPLPVGFPTPEVYSVVLVEQLFERGRMIWFEPLRQVWILEGDDIDPTSGTWTCQLDEFVDGLLERDPALDPPLGITTASQVQGAVPQQPVRGFGKIWRETEDLREVLGWAVTPETLFTTRYEYRAGGSMRGTKYEAAPGEYRITSLYQYTLVFEEDTLKAPCEDKAGIWRIE